MTRYLSLEEVLELHRLIVEQSGGSDGIRDISGLESSLAQPQMTFDCRDLYPSVGDKAAALGFSLIGNHPFIDGNKRVGHAALETFLLLNGWELVADIEEQEHVVLELAAGRMSREAFTAWVQTHLKKRSA